MLEKIFEPFINKSPVSVMARGLAERILEPERLDAWFEGLDTPQYTRDLLFSSVFGLMSQVVRGTRKSVNAACQAARDELGTSIVSVYNKLKCLDTRTSAGLVSYAASEAIPVMEQLGGTLPLLLPGYRVKLPDGNCIEASEHRIKALRTLAAGVLPGKSLVVFDPALHIPVTAFLCEDGHARERSLLDEVLKTVEPGDAWVADRNFCTLSFLHGIARADGFFVIREHKNLPREAVSELRPAGGTDTGKLFEQKISITDEHGNALDLRRIVLRLKKDTRDGDKEIVILTNLSKSAAHARQVAMLYRNRWMIETAFQELTVHLNSEINTLGYPRAALFAFCVALVAYIIMATLKAALRGVHGVKTIEDNFSGYYLADELSGVCQGMMISIPAHQWVIFRRLTQEQFIQCLKMLAGNVKLSRFQKYSRGPKKPAPKRISDPKTPHVSTAKLLAGRK